MTRQELLDFRDYYEGLITPQVRNRVRQGIREALAELQRAANENPAGIEHEALLFLQWVWAPAGQAILNA